MEEPPVRWLGHRSRADVAIGVDGSLSVAEGRAVGESVRLAVMQEVRFLDAVLVHVDSARSGVLSAERAGVAAEFIKGG